MNIRFSGFGGQGIVLSGLIMGWAAIFDDKNAIQTQSYGSEARGGACKCDVIIDDKTINELEPSQLDLLLAFSQPAYDKYSAYLKDGGVLFVDRDLVDVSGGIKPGRMFSAAATDIAFKELGYKIMANMVMLGYITDRTGIVSTDSMIKSITRNVPQHFVESNLKAFDIGLEIE